MSGETVSRIGRDNRDQRRRAAQVAFRAWATRWDFAFGAALVFLGIYLGAAWLVERAG